MAEKKVDTIALGASALMPLDGDTPPPTPGDAGQPADDALIGRVVDGRYRVLAQLGQGGIGAVYEAEHVEMKKRVALKILRNAFARTDEFGKRFEREARSASRLSHPGCVSTLDFGRIAKVEPSDDALVGTPYLVMELVRGRLLHDRMATGALPPAEAVRIARGALAALRHAHDLGIVHRDLKPGNIMLAEGAEGQPLVKLLDFGLAKDISPDSPDAQQPLTQAGMVFGTPGYISPEQAAGQPADARADLYAIGVILYEMLTGEPPFAKGDALELLRHHLSTPAPSARARVPSLSPALEEVLARTLVKDPARRWQSAEALSAALAACPEGASPPSSALRAAVTAPSPPRPRAPWLMLGGLAALMVVLVVVAVLVQRPAPAPPPPTVFASPPPALGNAASARRHLERADEYQRKLWCSDAVDELERALRDDPGLRTNPELVRTAVPCLRARVQAKTVRFLVEGLGAPARPELEAALRVETKPDVREGLERALARLK